jgi:2-amino-4-hydroxy-6-hydroxymethyldihydropteridine diphosphokinase
LGDRTATLDAAVAALARATDVQLLRQSAWQMTLPVGSRSMQNQFLNGAVLVETSRSPQELLTLLQQIENQFGRERHERWGNRTLDLDLLLQGDTVIDSPLLSVPHPRMSFRRFVLEPAAEIAGDMLHPTISCTVSHLLAFLEIGSDSVAIVSHDGETRRDIADKLVAKYAMKTCPASTSNQDRWPTELSTWLSIPNSPRSIGHPKLTVMIHEGFADASVFAMGRGPTLRVPASDGQDMETDVFAAIEAVWPRLGRSPGERLQ